MTLSREELERRLVAKMGEVGEVLAQIAYRALTPTPAPVAPGSDKS